MRPNKLVLDVDCQYFSNRYSKSPKRINGDIIRQLPFNTVVLVLKCSSNQFGKRLYLHIYLKRPILRTFF